MICSISCHHRLCWWKSSISNMFGRKFFYFILRVKVEAAIWGSWSSNSLEGFVSITFTDLGYCLYVFFFLICFLVLTGSKLVVIPTQSGVWCTLVTAYNSDYQHLYQSDVCSSSHAYFYVYLMFYVQWNGSSIFLFKLLQLLLIIVATICSSRTIMLKSCPLCLFCCPSGRLMLLDQNGFGFP